MTQYNVDKWTVRDDALPLWSVHCECGSITVSGATPYNMIYAIKANKLTREMDINTIHSLVACPICVCTPQLVGWVYMMWSLRLTIHWHSLNIPRILFTFVRVFNWHNFHGILCVIHSVGVCTLCARQVVLHPPTALRQQLWHSCFVLQSSSGQLCCRCDCCVERNHILQSCCCRCRCRWRWWRWCHHHWGCAAFVVAGRLSLGWRCGWRTRAVLNLIKTPSGSVFKFCIQLKQQSQSEMAEDRAEKDE